jgi:hypothetical protein
MSNYPYSDETVKAQTDAYMDELQLKQQPASTTQQQPSAPETPHPADQASEQSSSQRKAQYTKFAIGKFNDYLSWFIMVLETLLALQFLLKLIGAASTNPFAGFLYILTDILLLPFNGIVPSPMIHWPNQSVEFPTLIGMLVYYLVYFAIRRFFHLLISRPEDSAAE